MEPLSGESPPIQVQPKLTTRGFDVKKFQPLQNYSLQISANRQQTGAQTIASRRGLISKPADPDNPRARLIRTSRRASPVDKSFPRSPPRRVLPLNRAQTKRRPAGRRQSAGFFATSDRSRLVPRFAAIRNRQKYSHWKKENGVKPDKHNRR